MNLISILAATLFLWTQVVFGVQFTTENKCSFSVSPGIQGRSKADLNWKLPFDGGWTLEPGQSVSFDGKNKARIYHI